MCACVWLYTSRNDLTGALQAVMEFHNRYTHLPRIHDVIVGLVEKGDTEQLQIGTHTLCIQQALSLCQLFMIHESIPKAFHKTEHSSTVMSDNFRQIKSCQAFSGSINLNVYICGF